MRRSIEALIITLLIPLIIIAVVHWVGEHFRHVPKMVAAAVGVEPTHVPPQQRSIR